MYNNHMGVELYISNTFRGAFEGLAMAIERNGKDKPSIVIVPDRFSLTIEKAILDKLRISGTMSIRVMSFSRLAALTLGDKALKCLSAENSAMLMNKVVRSVRDKLRCYGKVRDLTSLSRDLYAAISGIRNSGITVAALREKLCKIKNQGIRNKTEDIILVYEGYMRELAERYNDNTTRLEAFAAEISEDRIIRESNVYITDFYTFKDSEYKIIKELMKYALSVGIALIDSPGGSLNGRIYPCTAIKKLAEELNVEVKERYSPIRLSEENALIERYLFSYRAPENKAFTNKVRLLRASTIENELVTVARMIREDILSGARYRDIALLAGNLDVYAPYIRVIFKRFGIPFFIDRGVNMAEHPLVLFLESLYNFTKSESINSAFDVSKNVFSGIDIEDAYALENYCIKYGIRGRGLYTYRIDNEPADRARRRIIELTKVIDTRGSATVETFIDCLNKLLELINADALLKVLSDKQRDLTDRAQSEVTRQIPVKLNEIIEGMREMLGGESTDIEEFSGMFNAAVSGTSISMIPQYIDSVFVGEPEESRYARIKTLYVVGSDERVMPPPRKDQGIIGEKECKEWDIEIYPSRKLSANLDKLALLQLLIKPEKALNVSYSMHSEKNEFLNPSSIIKQFQSIFNIEIESAESVYKDNYSVSEEERAELYGARFSTEENGVRELSEGMRRMRAGQLTNIDIKPYDALYSLTNGDRKARIGLIDAFGRSGKEVGQGALLERSGDKTSVSRLESYFACPFMHYAKYGIGARKREEAVIEADVRGTFIHTALELIVKRIMNKPAGFESSENEIADIRRNVIEELIDSPEYSRLISSSDRPLIIAGTERAVQYMLFAVRKSGFKPFLVEERIGGINIPSPIMNFGTDGRVALVGKIDRIDRLDNKVIVIDYKTGKVQDLATDLYYGKKIQLFIYLSALQDIGYEPVGALYMKLKDEFRKEENETFYQGIIAVEELETFDPPLGEALLDQKDSAEGSLIYNLMEYSRSVASGALNEIYNGYYENRPLTGTCGYCDYKDICFARMNEPNIRKSGKVKADETVFKGDRDA